MMNTVRSPTRTTPTTVSLVDVIITNKDSPILNTAVVDLGFSDHHAQLVRIDTGKRISSTKTSVRRQFTLEQKNKCKETVHTGAQKQV
jgi:hypothetical protein